MGLKRDQLEALRRLAAGNDTTDQRDQVAGQSLVAGAMRGRALFLGCSGDLEKLRLSLEGSAIALGFTRTGEYIFEHGAVTVEAGDAGPDFARSLASWLGVPLDDSGAGRSEVEVTYARLGAGRDAGGDRWDLFKLFVAAGEQHAELFLRVRADRQQAAFAEKWSDYREPLALLIDAAVGLGRGALPHRPLAVGGRQIELSLPPDWIASDGKGCVKVTDPGDDCLLELSYFHLPPLAPGAPGVAEQLEITLAESDHPAPITATRRLGVDLAWGEYDFECADEHRGDTVRAARGRWTLASNGTIQAFLTFYYWVDDASWAVPAWERLIDTMRLGDGAGLSGYGSGPLHWTDEPPSDLIPDVSR